MSEHHELINHNAITNSQFKYPSLPHYPCQVNCQIDLSCNWCHYHPLTGLTKQPSTSSQHSLPSWHSPNSQAVLRHMDQMPYPVFSGLASLRRCALTLVPWFGRRPTCPIFSIPSAPNSIGGLPTYPSQSATGPQAQHHWASE